MGEQTLDSENAAFWLPTHFLTDDDFLSDEIGFKKDERLFSNSLRFEPNSSIDSPVSSTETERGDNNGNDKNDDDMFMAELTRYLARTSLNDSSDEQKPWMISTSPQSTLTGFGPWTSRSGFSSNGSPNGPSQVPSPPLTPPAKNDAAWELLYEAAGQVACLKMNALAAQMNQNHHNRGLLRAPHNIPYSKSHQSHHNSYYDFPQYEQVKRQGNGGFNCQHHSHNHIQQRSGPLGISQSAWPSLRPNHHNHHHRQPSNGLRPVYPNGSGIPGIKRQSTGTGVFLPRRVGTTTTHQQPEPRKKPTGCTTGIHPARVIEASNMDCEPMKMKNGFGLSSNSRFVPGILSENEILLARRNAILEQQMKYLMRKEVAATTMVGHEIYLPSDWKY
ncbi:uncharacterized protein LOC130803546 isoform X1 [Amaranthus tricolor]|uniref:uncharacterized protein LOC130803546 isoform X1 n=1 Tax=Amaranthus tricolor TaxID=29722 RepID=UPI00258CD155|nr:uncharacterized protein LOC130803546 isoform X1 [Amaranthus tricolor]